MTVFDKIREKSKVISFIVKILNSPLYPALFALVCAISGTCGKEVFLPCFLVVSLVAVFAGLFSNDLKVFIVPTFLLYYAIGIDVSPEYYDSYQPPPPFDFSVAPFLVACALMIFAVLVYRLIAGGHVKETLAKRGIFFWGIILMGGSFVLGGFFSDSFSITSLLFGLLLAFVFIMSYILFLVLFSHSENSIPYACKTLVCLGYLVVAQILTIAYRLNLNDNFIFIHGGTGELTINRLMLSLSWGPATIIGAVMVLPIVGAIYLMRTHRFPLFSFISAIIFWLATILIDTRSAIITGAAVLFFGFIFCCLGGKNKKINRITVISLFSLILLALIAFACVFPDKLKSIVTGVLDLLRLSPEKESGVDGFLSNRLELWAKGIDAFLSAPVFGKGFAYVPPGEMASSKYFDFMYHNVFVQLLGSTGIVGVLLFIFHLKHILEVTLRRFSLEKLMLLMVPACVLVMSLVDNFFFYPNFIIVYTAFLAAAEIYLESAREKRLNNLKKPRKSGKPRVVFTYVEAGKGHIIPTKNVCNSFRAKYGDKVDVIESRFFTETGEPDMQKSEKLFSKAVKQSNRSPIMSFLFKLGNVLAGDTVAILGLLTWTWSGKKTTPLAIKHIEELDADVIYTAHWSIPFYVNQLKTPRPYTVCFCPDIYSNGAFNVDCNRFLIPSDVGYKQICRHRMYAGGNVTQIPFPMRPEAEAYKGEGKREECRAALGIPNDEFVVVLCDGGYGMARLESTARALLKSKAPMTVIALCGTNKKLYNKLSALEKTTPSHIRLITVDFTDRPLDYMVCADVFAGKSGANSIAEPAALGIPIVVTKCATYIERGIKNYYVRDIKGAVYRPSARAAAKKITEFATSPELLKKYKTNLRTSTRLHYDADASADILFESLKKIYPNI